VGGIVSEWRKRRERGRTRELDFFSSFCNYTMYLVGGAGMAQRQDNLAEFPLGDACPRHIP